MNNEDERKKLLYLQAFSIKVSEAVKHLQKQFADLETEENESQDN